MGLLEMLMTPSKGCVSSKIRKIAAATERDANSCMIITIMLGGANKPMLMNVKASQNTAMTISTMEVEDSVSSKSSHRICPRSAVRSATCDLNFSCASD